MDKKTKREVDTVQREADALKRRVEEMRETNGGLARELAAARTLLEQGAEMVVKLGEQYDAARLERDQALAELKAVRERAAADVARANAEAASARESEQQHKLRMVKAEKVGQRLWKAIEQKNMKDVEKYRDTHVGKGASGTLVLLTD